MDSVAAQKAFSDKFGVTFPLLSDPTGVVCDRFKVAHQNNRAARETFLFRRGKLAVLDRNVQPKTMAQDLLRWMDELEAR